MHKVILKVGYKFFHSVICRGSGKDRVGGLCLFWKEPKLIKVMSFSDNHIGGNCQLDDNDNPWFFSGFYGFPEKHLKKDTWNLVQEVNRELAGRFVCFGDFNVILQDGEKVGGNRRSVGQYAWGRHTLDSCNFHDLGFSGYKFTWSNGRRGRENIQCRLDGGFGNRSFLEAFPFSKVIHLPKFGLDHAVLRILVEKDVMREKIQHLFRFEDVRSKDPSCGLLVRQLWAGTTGSLCAKSKSLHFLQYVFKECGTGNIAKELKSIELLLQEDVRWSGRWEDISQYKFLEAQRNKLLKLEETTRSVSSTV